MNKIARTLRAQKTAANVDGSYGRRLCRIAVSRKKCGS